MANGDIQIKVLYRQSFGGGQEYDGTKANTKTLVVGEITGTYVAAGLSLGAAGTAPFGLTNVDYLKLEPITSNALYHTVAAVISADWNRSTNKIFMTKDNGAAAPAVPSNGHVIVLRFFAVGDDATAPELT